MKEIDILRWAWLGTGFGDTINHISFLYNNYDNTIFNCYFPPSVIGTWNRIIETTLDPHPNIKFNFIKTTYDNDPLYPFHDRKNEFQESIVGHVNHDYWPTRKKRKNIQDFVAINLYRKHKERHSWKIIKSDNDYLNIIRYMYKEWDMVSVDLPHATLPNTATRRNVKTNCFKDAEQILSRCKFFITSESGYAHLAKAMRVPQIVYYDKSAYNKMWFSKHKNLMLNWDDKNSLHRHVNTLTDFNLLTYKVNEILEKANE